MRGTVARSLGEAYQNRATALSLLLSKSPDLACVNLMCEHVSKGCACRLSLTLERMESLRELDISNNALPLLPDSLFSSLPFLSTVRASSNHLRALPASLRQCKTLEVLDLRENSLEILPLEALETLPLLKSLLLGGNPLSTATLQGLQASRLWGKSIVLL